MTTYESRAIAVGRQRPTKQTSLVAAFRRLRRRPELCSFKLIARCGRRPLRRHLPASKLFAYIHASSRYPPGWHDQQSYVQHHPRRSRVHAGYQNLERYSALYDRPPWALGLILARRLHLLDYRKRPNPARPPRSVYERLQRGLRL
jgi:hypothetical protein